MDLFDRMKRDIAGASMTVAMGQLIERCGGVQGIVALLQEKGLGETARSWVESGANLPISAAEVGHVFGAEVLSGVASRMGVDSERAAERLARFLPLVIDALTPQGTIPRPPS
jgi:uncharacterized protein YidB (DUF937 family)